MFALGRLARMYTFLVDFAFYLVATILCTMRLGFERRCRIESRIRWFVVDCSRLVSPVIGYSVAFVLLANTKRFAAITRRVLVSESDGDSIGNEGFPSSLLRSPLSPVGRECDMGELDLLER